MNRSALEEKPSFKTLRLTSSSKLDWGSYSISIAKTTYKKIGALICSMKFLSPEVALYPYKSTIWPCMECCYHVWADAPSSFLELLDKLHKQIDRPVGLHLPVSGGKKCSFSGKFCVFCFLIIPILRFALFSLLPTICCKPLSIVGNQLTFTYSKPTVETLEKSCEVCSKLTIKTPEWCLSCYLWIYFTLFSSVFIVDFNYVYISWV